MSEPDVSYMLGKLDGTCTAILVNQEKQDERLIVLEHTLKELKESKATFLGWASGVSAAVSVGVAVVHHWITGGK